MKEIFESLAEESMVHVPGAKGLHTRAFSLEKYSELIVQDCIRILETRKDHTVVVNAIKEIREHFGVEE